MEATLTKWGNSLGIRIPKEAAENMGIKAGDCVDVITEGKSLVIRKKLQRRSFRDIVKDCTGPYESEWVDFGRPEGDEIW